MSGIADTCDVYGTEYSGTASLSWMYGSNCYIEPSMPYDYGYAFDSSFKLCASDLDEKEGGREYKRQWYSPGTA